VKICNQLESEKIWFLRQDPGWSDLILARGQIDPGKWFKGQTKILGPASVIWDKISQMWPQKGQPGNPSASGTTK